jgi:predicted transcriptional regulator
MELTRDEVVAVVDRAVTELLESARCDRPPVDALELARGHLGLEVCVDRRQPQRGRAQRANGRGHIYLRPEVSPERQQWTVAHEIGEHLKVSLLQRLGLDPDELGRMTGESLANLFAYRLLAPQLWLAQDARDFDFEVPRLKERYRTASHEVIAWRLLDLPDPCVITIVDNDRVTRRRSNAWPVTRRLAAAEQVCQKRVHDSGRPRTVNKEGWSVRGWPVHQPDWKREILRSVFEE